MDLTGLTRREREILALTGQGMTAAEIAEHLHRSIRTVHAHRYALCRKLGMHSSVQLARIAVDAGLAPASAARPQPTGDDACAAWLLWQITAATADRTGIAFLEHLSAALLDDTGSQLSMIARLDGDGHTVVPVVAATPGGPIALEPFECGHSPFHDLADKRVHDVDRVAQRYPLWATRLPIRPEQVLACPLVDPRKRTIGYLSLAAEDQIPTDLGLDRLLPLLASRAQIEIERVIGTDDHATHAAPDVITNPKIFNGFPMPAYVWRRIGDSIRLVASNDAGRDLIGDRLDEVMAGELDDFRHEWPENCRDVRLCIEMKSSREGGELLYRRRPEEPERLLRFTYRYLPPDSVMVCVEPLSAPLDAVSEGDDWFDEQVASCRGQNGDE
jgi:DNA-binding CsgD family transcriptional regulator